MAIEVFNRYEHKYLLDSEQFDRIIGVLDEKMETDKHNDEHRLYEILNIYFDTDDNFLIRNSLSKPEYKEKLRMRSYGRPESHEDMVFLEIKKKYKGLVNKRRTKMTLKEAREFVETGVAPRCREYMNWQVVREIEYFLKVYNPSPKVLLAYDRIAYFDRADHDLRISFDINIRARRNMLCLEEGGFGEQLLEEGVYLMEVKTAKAKPLWLCRLLQENGISRRSFSKYGTEFKKFMEKEYTFV